MAAGIVEMVFQADLPMTEKLVMLELANRANVEGDGIYARQNVIAERCGIVRQTLNRTLARLEDRGLIIKDGFHSRNIVRWKIDMEHLTCLAERHVSYDDLSPRVTAPVSESDSTCRAERQLSNNKDRTVHEQSMKGPRPKDISEVLDYGSEIGLPKIECEKFFDHFSSNGWKVGGKAPMKDWQSALRNWRRNCDPGQMSQAPVKPKSYSGVENPDGTIRLVSS